MGMDVQGLYTVIHYGSPADTDDYLQETGRAGRQGDESVAVLLHHSKAFIICKPSAAMKAYVEGTACRRQTLLKSFETGDEQPPATFTCCDICDKETPSWVEKEIVPSPTGSVVRRDVMDTDKDELKQKLEMYRAKLIDDLASDGLLAGPDLATCFPETFIKRLVAECDKVMTFEQFWKFHPFCDKSQALDVYNLMEEVLGECCQIETVHLSVAGHVAEEFEDSDSESEYQEIILDASDQSDED